MSDEKQEKTRKPAIGGIGRQYATLGGRKRQLQMFKHLRL